MFDQPTIPYGIEKRETMGIGISIRNQDGELLHDMGQEQAGTLLVLNQEGSCSKACWTYNYYRIWNEIGWSPWNLFGENRDQPVPATSELRTLFIQKLEAVRSLPDQRRCRSSGVEKLNDYYAATPANAFKCLIWILSWLSKPNATTLVCDSP